MAMRVKPTLIIPTLALKSVTSKTGAGVYASSDTLFKGAVFGRDSLEVAEDLLRTHRHLVKSILLTLGRLQGLESHDLREEEPGKIVHEYRSVVVDGKHIDKTSLEIFTNLSHKWGGNAAEMAYYGSIDATPHFVRTLDRYVQTYGKKILTQTVRQRDGREVTMHQVALAAIDWLMQALETSRSGLLEYHRRNPRGILNQVWKDSDEFYIHENKDLVNHEAPIASIEVQGLVYDALMAATRLGASDTETYHQKAWAVRDRTIELLWQAERNYFSLGLDHDRQGTRRIITTPTANPAALLDTGFFDELPTDDRQRYLTAIIKTIMSHDFLTDAGIRSRALSLADLIDFWDYHGSYVSWPKETYDIAKGLLRQGFPRLATQLENRILNLILKSQQYPEFVYIDDKGRVLATNSVSYPHGDIILVEGSNTPERIQAWTVSAVVAIVNARLVQTFKPAKPPAQEPWQSELEKTILTDIHRVKTYLNPFALSARYPTYRYRLTRGSGH